MPTIRSLPKTRSISNSRKFIKNKAKPKKPQIFIFKSQKRRAKPKTRTAKPIPMTQTASEAKKKLEEINPEKAKDIQEPAPESPLGLG